MDIEGKEYEACMGTALHSTPSTQVWRRFRTVCIFLLGLSVAFEIHIVSNSRTFTGTPQIGTEHTGHTGNSSFLTSIEERLDETDNSPLGLGLGDDDNFPDRVEDDEDHFSDWVEFQDMPNETELGWWWKQPLSREDVSSHIFYEYFPVDLTNISLPIHPRFTREWRRNSLLALLEVWAALCRLLKLTYWLDAGSLLGRMRSNGTSLIPWDGDVDIGMMRDEFEKLAAVLHRTALGKLGVPDGVKITVNLGWTLPGRVIDTHTGFYLDVFNFYFRKDGNIQELWHYSGTQVCDEKVSTEGGCEPPCNGNAMCYIFKKEDILPPVACNLAGVRDGLLCPRNELLYLKTMYNSCCSPDRHWDPSSRDFH